MQRSDEARMASRLSVEARFSPYTGVRALADYGLAIMGLVDAHRTLASVTDDKDKSRGMLEEADRLSAEAFKLFEKMTEEINDGRVDQIPFGIGSSKL